MMNWYRNIAVRVAIITLVLGFGGRASAFVVPDYVGWTIDEAVTDAKTLGLYVYSLTVDESEDPETWNKITWQSREAGTEAGVGQMIQFNAAREPGVIESEFLSPEPGSHLSIGDQFTVRTSKPISYYDYQGGSYWMDFGMFHLEYNMLGGDSWPNTSNYGTVELIEIGADAQTFTYRISESAADGVYVFRGVTQDAPDLGPITYFAVGSATAPSGDIWGNVFLPTWASTFSIDKTVSQVFLRPTSMFGDRQDLLRPAAVQSMTDVWRDFTPSLAFGYSGFGEPSSGAYPYRIKPVTPGEYYLVVMARAWQGSQNYGRFLFGAFSYDQTGAPSLFNVTGYSQMANLTVKGSALGIAQGDAYFVPDETTAFRFDNGGPVPQGQSPDLQIAAVSEWYDIVSGRPGVKFAWLGWKWSLNLQMRSPYPGTPNFPSPDDTGAWFTSIEDAAANADQSVWGGVFGVLLPDNTYAIIVFTDPDESSMSKPASDQAERPTREATDVDGWAHYIQWAWQPDGTTNFGPPVPAEIEMPNVVGLTLDEARDVIKQVATVQFFDIDDVVTTNPDEYGRVLEQNPSPGQLIWNQDLWVDLSVGGPPATEVNIVSVTPADGATSVGTPIGDEKVEVAVTVTLDMPLEFVVEGDENSPYFGEEIPNIEIDIIGGGIGMNSVYPVYGWNEDNTVISMTVILDENRVYDYIIGPRDNNDVGSQLSESSIVFGTFSTGATFPGATLSGAISIPVSGLPVEGVFLVNRPPFAVDFDDFGPVRLSRVDDGTYQIRGVEPGTYWLMGIAMDTGSFDGHEMPQIFMGVYDPEDDGFPNAIVVSDASPISGLDITLKEFDFWMMNQLSVVSIVPYPLTTNVPTDGNISVSFSDPLVEAGDGYPEIEIDLFPPSSVPVTRESATLLDDNRTVSWETGLEADQAYQFVIWEATASSGYDLKHLGMPMIIPFTTGAAMPSGEVVINVETPDGVIPDNPAFAAALFTTPPASMNPDTWEPDWFGISASKQIHVRYVPDGTYYVAVVPIAENLRPALWTEGGIPQRTVVSGGSNEITVAVTEGLPGVVTAYPEPDAVNVSTETTIAIEFADPVPTSDGEPQINIMLWPQPLSAGGITLSEDGHTLSRDVLLAESMTYQVFVVAEQQMPLSYVFSTGAALDAGLIAGRLSINVEMFGGGDTPQKPSRESVLDWPFAVALVTELPPVLDLESAAATGAITRVAMSLNGDFTLRNIPPGQYYAIAMSLNDSPGTPRLFGFLDENKDAVPDLITVEPAQQITGVNLGINQLFGWPRLIAANPPMFGTGVPSGEPVTLSLTFSADFVPSGDGSSVGELQVFPPPLSGYISGQDFDLIENPDGTWTASTDVVLAEGVTYSIWIFDAQSNEGSMMFPMRHVFTTADAIPNGTISGTVTIPPLVMPYYSDGAFVMVSNKPGVPDITGDMLTAIESSVGFGFLYDTTPTSGRFTVNYLPYGEVYATAFLVRDMDPVQEQPSIIDYGQPDEDCDGTGDAVVLSAQNPKANVDITITDRQSHLRVVESSIPDGAVSVPMTTTMTLKFSEPVFSDGVWMHDEIMLIPSPTSMEVSPGENDSTLVLNVTLAQGTTYQLLLVFQQEKMHQQVFTTATTLGTGSIAGTVSKATQLPPAYAAFVALLSGLPSSTDIESWPIARLTQTIGGDYVFEDLDPGVYYIMAFGYFAGYETEVISQLNPPAVAVNAGQQVTGANVGIGLTNVAMPPDVRSFNASVAYITQEVPMVGTLNIYVPVISARITDPNGLNTIQSVTITLPNGTQVPVQPTPDGEYELILDPLQTFAGGTFSIVATDAGGATSTVETDYVAPITIGKPNVVSPINGAVDVSLTPRLDWSNVTGARGYLVHVSTESPESAIPAQGVAAFLSPENSVISFRDQILATSEMQVAAGRLSPNTQYWWAVGAVDDMSDPDQIVLSNVGTFTTRSGEATVDTRPPALETNPEIIGTTESTITVRWVTDEASDSRVYYGAMAAMLNDSTVDSRLVLDHTIRLTNLNPGAEYFLAISSRDAAGNRLFYMLPRSVRTKSAADTQPPTFVAEPRTEGIGQDQVTILWETNKASTGTVRIVGLGLDTTIVDNVLARSHRLGVTGLSPATLYQFSVTAKDENNNTSAPFFGRPFTTRAVEDTRPPRLLERPLVNARETDAIIHWLADELHTSTVVVRNAATRAIVSETYQTKPGMGQIAVVSGLTAGTQYEATVQLRDGFGNVNNELLPVGFRTRAVADVTPPRLITPPNIEYRSNNRIVLVWETDEPSDSYVRIIRNGQTVDEFTDGAFVRRHRMVITGLQAGQDYEFQIASRDPAGNELVYPEEVAKPTTGRVAKTTGRGASTFTTSVAADTQYPVITSSPTVASRTASTLTINWQTDETANSVVYYGDASGGKLSQGAAVNLTSSVIRTDYVTQHSVTISGLEPGTPYLWKVASTDPSGNGETEGGEIMTSTMASEDVTPPVFVTAPEVIGRTDSRLTLRWHTDEPANSVVRYRRAGTSDVLEEVIDQTLVTEHVITLTNLAASQNYDITALSMDLIGNGPTSASTTGTTDAGADVTAPVVDQVAVTPDAVQARLTWTTNEPADSWVNFGTTQAYGTVVSKSALATSHEIILTNLTKTTQYYYQIASADASGNITNITNLSFTTLDAADTTPPERITGLTATKGAYAVRLTWPAGEDSADVAGYLIERRVGGGAFEPLAGPISARLFTDQTVTVGTQYAYRVLAKDVSANGNISAPSDTVFVTPTVNDAPNAPVAVTFDTTAVLDPLLAVKNATANIRPISSYAFILARDANLTQVVSTGTGVIPAADTTKWQVPIELEHGVTYWWSARAVDAEGFAGPQTATASFIVDTTYKPTSIALASFAATSHGRTVTVSWEIASGSALGFHVLRSAGIDGTPERITGTMLIGGPAFEWIDVDVASGHEYAYRIEALLPSGESQVFGPVIATAATPREVALRQNLPNPFNPATLVRYELPEHAHVQLVVYNALGQPVRTLVNASRAAGWHAVTWDGIDDAGRAAASGVYIARLVVVDIADANHREIRVMRMLMVR